MINLLHMNYLLKGRCFYIFQQFVKKYGKSVIFPGTLCLVILYFSLQQNNSDASSEELITTIPQETIQSNTEQQNTEEKVEITNDKVIVDVKGAVKFPGVYELNIEDRVIDAIELAGGYTDEAESQSINHAQKLQDEMVIYIPKKGENLEEQTKLLGQAVTISSPNSNESDGKVNLNTADESQLTTLPGIGPSKAQAILSYRDENGPFQTIDDLKNVTGIGDKTFEKLKELIVVK